MSRFLVKAGIFLASVAVLLAGCHSASEVQGGVPLVAPLRIDGVTIVDTRDGKLTPGMSILMDHGEIAAITPTSSTLKAPGMLSVDASGKFVVPGYNDMHVHVLDQANASALLALMLTEGVTGFRQMSGSPELLAQRRDGKLPIGKDAPALLAMPGNVLTPFNAGSLQQVQSEIRQQKLQGADFIKVGILDPRVFSEAIAESTRVGLSIVGHLQEGVDAAQASQEGFRSIEHLGPGDTVWIACSANQAALLAESAQHPIMKAPRIRIPGFIQKMATPWIQKRLINPAAFEDTADVARLQRALDTYDGEKCRTLAALFAGEIVTALDPDRHVEAARAARAAAGADPHAEPTEAEIAQARKQMLHQAAKPLAANPALRNLILGIKKSYEQIIDTVNQDHLLEAGPAEVVRERALRMVQSFEQFLREHKDEIEVLQILYSKPYAVGLSLKQVKALANLIEKPIDGSSHVTPDQLWRAYERIDASHARGSRTEVAADLVNLVRFALKQEPQLEPRRAEVESRFAAWLRSQQSAGTDFRPDQLRWLEAIRDHIASSLAVEPEDMELDPFSRWGGLGRAQQVFGDRFLPLLNELNEVLAA